MSSRAVNFTKVARLQPIVATSAISGSLPRAHMREVGLDLLARRRLEADDGFGFDLLQRRQPRLRPGFTQITFAAY